MFRVAKLYYILTLKIIKLNALEAFNIGYFTSTIHELVKTSSTAAERRTGVPNDHF